MILLPLYFQIVRHESVVQTGLLLVPQSLGAAAAMPFAGRLADRFGGGPIALAGVILTALATLPFAFVDEATSYWLIEASLLLRGLGIGFAMMPAMSAAYAVLKPEQIADATPQLTVVQRVGGSIGTARARRCPQRRARGPDDRVGDGGRLLDRLLVGARPHGRRDRAGSHPAPGRAGRAPRPHGRG